MVKKRLGRPIKMKDPTKKILLSLRVTTVDGLDAWVEEIREQTIGGGSVTRTDLARDILERAVEAHQKKVKR